MPRGLLLRHAQLRASAFHRVPDFKRIDHRDLFPALNNDNHIEKIEKRYSVDLSDTVTRNNLLDEFRLYFLTDGFTREPDYDALLSIEEIEEHSLL